MDFEVVVVGGGIGGLATAALLAARGVSVGLFERQSRVGGCVANFEHFGYQFEPTYGLYSGWETGAIYDRIFSELPAEPPSIKEQPSAYTVRLPDAVDMTFNNNVLEFQQHLRLAFPECAEAAIHFYRGLETAASQAQTNVAAHLHQCSPRFRRFIDVQLQTFTQSSSDECRYDRAAVALNPGRRFWTISGGAQSLADTLAASLKTSGGMLRLNAPVLRLAYLTDGVPIGIDLLNGERIIAKRAIVSNLTVWDTYGKLVGLNRTPAMISSRLKTLRGWGAYLLFLGVESAVVSRLPSDRVLALTDWQEDESYDPAGAQFMFAAALEPDNRAPENKVAVTVSTFTRAEDWFSFHEDHTAHEAHDQLALESLWSRLHAAMPELGDSVEVIDTATPQTFYETTRRKFGIVGGANGYGEVPTSFAETPFPNLFLVGDTVGPTLGLETVVESAASLASLIMRYC